MNKRLLLSLLAASLSATWLHAAEEEDEYSPELGIFASAKNSVKFGFRMVGGAKVHFGNLGIVPLRDVIAPASAGEATRIYSNGTVVADTLRADEQFPATVNPAPGETLLSTVVGPDGRYQTFASTNNAGTITTTQTGDFLSLAAGRTRNWRYDSATQLNANGSGIIMSAFSATSDGAGFDGKKQSSTGIEFELERVLGKLGGRWEISLVGGIALSGISSKQSGNVRSTLHTLSDTFSLNGQTAPDVALGTQPTFDTLTLPDTTTVARGLETTVPLASVPDAASHTETAVTGAANVAGVWRIKGAYYVMKVGPEVRTNLTKDFGLSASIGLAGAYAGTNYTANETLTVDGLAAPIVGVPETSSVSKFLPGYYANLDALWQANERTGFFAGVTYEQFSSYDQSVGGRTARIDLGATAGIHGGISIKF